MVDTRPLTISDVPLGLRLSTQAGWNQTEVDWRRMLALEPEGGFVAEWDGVPVGTAVAVTFSPLAWIAMVLVDESHRGRGLGRQLVARAMAFAQSAGARTIRLDATPLGRPVYERLGFRAQFELDRWDGVLPQDVPAVFDNRFEIVLSTPSPDAIDAVSEFDQEVTRTFRRKLLDALAASGASLWVARDRDGIAGYGTLRAGRLATFIGPCLASPEAGPPILQALLQSCAGQRVFVDIPQSNTVAAAVAKRAGLEVQRSLTRMCWGEPVQEDLGRLVASSGPELG